MLAPGRKQLVGLLTGDPSVVLEEGAQIVAEPDGHVRPLGHVTSAYFSATLGRSIALAMVAGGRDRTGERLHVTTAERPVAATVTAPVFYDPEGARLDAADVSAVAAGPLDGMAAPGSAALVALPGMWRSVLRGRAAAVEAAASAFGAALPLLACRAAVAGAGRAALWLGPDEWLLLASPADGPALAAALARAMEGPAAFAG